LELKAIFPWEKMLFVKRINRKKGGIHQGSIMEHPIFLTCINDIAGYTIDLYMLFVDDTSIREWCHDIAGYTYHGIILWWKCRPRPACTGLSYNQLYHCIILWWKCRPRTACTGLSYNDRPVHAVRGRHLHQRMMPWY
jgi:hypothetical protein